MSHFAEIPIDEGARDGAHHGLRAEDGTMHSGFWDGVTWVYSNAIPIGKPIVAYNARLPGNPTATLQ